MNDPTQSPLTEDHVAAATTYVLQIREDWSAGHVAAAIELCRRHRDHPTDEQIARSLMRAAADPSVRRPSYVPASRLWITLDQEDPGPASGQTGTDPAECRSCGQPGSTSNPPAYCPTCGEEWDPITPDGADLGDQGRRVTCTRCQHRQAGRFTYCGRCGAELAYPRPSPRPPSCQ